MSSDIKPQNHKRKRVNIHKHQKNNITNESRIYLLELMLQIFGSQKGITAKYAESQILSSKISAKYQNDIKQIFEYIKK